MIVTSLRRHLFVLLSLAAALYVNTASAAESDALLRVSGGWQVAFESGTSVLECRHAP